MPKPSSSLEADPENRDKNLEIAYILLRFPSLTETFIAEELINLHHIGIFPKIYSLLGPRKHLVHPTSQKLMENVEYAPAIRSSAIWMAQFGFLFQHPGKYFQLLWKVAWLALPDFSFFLKCLVIFLKSIWLAKQIERSGVQLVHAHFAWLPGLAEVLIQQIVDVPFTITTHAYDIFVQKNNLLDIVSNRAERIVTISDYNKKVMGDVCRQLNPEKIEVIRCGIDLNYFRLPLQKNPAEVFQITSVGSLIEKKGHEYLIRACQILKEQGHQFQCVIIGSGHLEASLREMIQQQKLEEMVILAGPQSQDWVKDRLSKSDLFVLACVVTEQGDRDGIPVAIMEAMALGVPVISTPVSGISELVRNRETGLLVPERDDASLAAAIQQLIGDKALREQYARQARMLVEQDYDISKNVNRLSALFEGVIQARHS